MERTVSARGWRKTARTWRRHSGSSSRKRTPWWASDTSPGIGTCPPLIKAHVPHGLAAGVGLWLPLPEGTKACGDHLLVSDGSREEAHTVGEAIQGGDGGFGNGRLIKWQVMLD
jgi:hypothetical protein